MAHGFEPEAASAITDLTETLLGMYYTPNEEEPEPDRESDATDDSDDEENLEYLDHLEDENDGIGISASDAYVRDPQHQEASQDEQAPRKRQRMAGRAHSEWWYPWADRTECTLDILMHLPRSVFSERQLALFLWLLKVN
ncbi:hypothetical protein VNI00_016014 [Paramarasmius palmivorus]|uniref:Uncharacterized protein n=1 Tax=Paramarasmius palmivorus TaxID=297713 RepID=A0AAW0BH55_9AGAR